MINRIIDKYLSRKFFVFSIATIMLFLRIIDEKTWLLVAMLYIGVEGVIDLIKSYFNRG